MRRLPAVIAFVFACAAGGVASAAVVKLEAQDGAVLILDRATVAEAGPIESSPDMSYSGELGKTAVYFRLADVGREAFARQRE